MALSSDTHDGHAFLIDGALWYTPNSQRTIQLPPPLIPGQSVNPFFKGATWESLHQPTRWSQAFGYLCFTPLTRHTLDTHPFCDLAHLPRLESDGELWGLPKRVIESWDYLNNAIYDVAMTLRGKFGVPCLLPYTPRAFRYHLKYRNRGKAHWIAARTRDWFVVWLGALSFIIAHIRSPADGSRPRHPPQQPSHQQNDKLKFKLEEWETYLYQHESLRKWQRFILQLGSSVVADPNSQEPRAGLIVDIMNKDDRGQPTIDWLLDHRIPVWYPWNDEVAHYAAANDLTHLAPPPHLLQTLQTTLYSTPSTQPLSQQAAKQGHHSSPLDPTNVAARREELRQIVQRYEDRVAATRNSPEWTQEEEERATNRARNPSAKKASVHVYEPSAEDPGRLERRSVTVAEREDTLDEFEESQRRYYPELNTWVCCDDFVETRVVPYDGEDDEELYPEILFDPSTLSTMTNAAPPAPDLAPSSTVVNFFPIIPNQHLEAAAVVPGFYSRSWYDDQEAVPRLQSDLLHFMRTHLGYIPPMPLPSGNASNPITPQIRSVFLRSLGVHPKVPAASDFGKTLIAQDMYKFIRQCLEKKPEDDKTKNPRLESWDIITDSPFRISHPSLYSLRVIHSSYKNGLLNNKQFKHFWFLFEDSAQELGWYMTLTTAAHALTVVRLRQAGSSYGDIAFLFLRRGVPFRTFKPFQRLLRTPYYPVPHRLLYRSPGYVFTKVDHSAYIHHRNIFLAHPRARAALLRGGILWRIASSYIECEDVLDGPTNSTDLSIVHPLFSEQLIDDALSQVEEAVLVGAYNCYTGHGQNQISIKSWFPFPEAFEKGEDQGHWSPFSEKWYQDRLDEIMYEGGVPLSKAEWRDRLHGRKETNILRSHLETRSRTCIEALAPASWSHLGLDHL